MTNKKSESLGPNYFVAWLNIGYLNIFKKGYWLIWFCFSLLILFDSCWAYEAQFASSLGPHHHILPQSYPQVLYICLVSLHPCCIPTFGWSLDCHSTLQEVRFKCKRSHHVSERINFRYQLNVKTTIKWSLSVSLMYLVDPTLSK